MCLRGVTLDTRTCVSECGQNRASREDIVHHRVYLRGPPPSLRSKPWRPQGTGRMLSSSASRLTRLPTPPPVFCHCARRGKVLFWDRTPRSRIPASPRPRVSALCMQPKVVRCDAKHHEGTYSVASISSRRLGSMSSSSVECASEESLWTCVHACQNVAKTGQAGRISYITKSTSVDHLPV
jgi:hypothetical protein